MAKFGFDTTEYESSGGDFEVMPKGEYTLKATEAELKNTKAGDGKYLAVTFEVVKGQYTGRKVWQNFNVVNKNAKAEQIGREQVSGWARAAGKPNANDSDQLLERPFNCNLGIEKGTGGYSDKNIIKSFVTGESKSSTPAPTSKGKFDEEEPTQTKAETAPKEAEKEEAPAPTKKEESGSAKKNPWD